MDALTSYLVAGARLAGCKSSPTISGGRDLVTPTGRRFVVPMGASTAGQVEEQDGYAWRKTAYQGLHDLLERWQPDRESSVSRQHYIDTGRYLPVGREERAALGVEEAADDAACRVCADAGRPYDPNFHDSVNCWADQS